MNRHISLLIVHPDEPCLLMQQRHDGWTLPCVPGGERSALGSLSRQTHEALGVATSLVRCAHQGYSQERARWEEIYLLECLDRRVTPPPAMHWIGPERIDRITLLEQGQREVLAQCLREEATGSIPARRPAWERRGWFASTCMWLEQTLPLLGYALVGDIETLKLWGFACVLRLPTTRGPFFLKVCPVPRVDRTPSSSGVWTHEVRLTHLLATLYPAHLPSLVAADEQHGWMISQDAGDLLSTHPSWEQWERAASVWGAVQMASATHVEALLAHGCPDRRLGRLPEQIISLLHDEKALALLRSRERDHLRSALPFLHDQCDHLNASGIPETLVHGDLHPDNIAVTQGTPLYFDWSDGCLSHPFFDLIHLRESRALSSSPERRSHLERHYFTSWSAALSWKQFQDALRMANVLGRVHQAISFQHCLDRAEPLWERCISDGLTFWMRSVLPLLPGDRIPRIED